MMETRASRHSSNIPHIFTGVQGLGLNSHCSKIKPMVK